MSEISGANFQATEEQPLGKVYSAGLSVVPGIKFPVTFQPQVKPDFGLFSAHPEVICDRELLLFSALELLGVEGVELLEALMLELDGVGCGALELLGSGGCEFELGSTIGSSLELLDSFGSPLEEFPDSSAEELLDNSSRLE